MAPAIQNVPAGRPYFSRPGVHTTMRIPRKPRAPGIRLIPSDGAGNGRHVRDSRLAGGDELYWLLLRGAFLANFPRGWHAATAIAIAARLRGRGPNADYLASLIFAGTLAPCLLVPCPPAVAGALCAAGEYARRTQWSRGYQGLISLNRIAFWFWTGAVYNRALAVRLSAARVYAKLRGELMWPPPACMDNLPSAARARWRWRNRITAAVVYEC